MHTSVDVLILLALSKVEQSPWEKPLIVLGSVPMFFYILHLYMLKFLYVIAVQIWGTNQGQYFGVNQMSYLWLIMLILLVALYPAVQAFSKFKHANK
ncbi:hypothetical protein P255_00736 [Acinetobacter brisouii CIP 110357]|uniref:Uncharacterized protein n=1 Tax=Acinetobacter brisouii CIP 110357 TaxID=1341683 RepID=V2UVA2_9GAMM|nr:hypothetical protein F954_02576 [Acinetobacter brisouii ANC 4119]ESK52580.1 hypothetical protein P255_00736 [Acinetobacter brisouii CIP 110357]